MRAQLPRRLRLPAALAGGFAVLLVAALVPARAHAEDDALFASRGPSYGPSGAVSTIDINLPTSTPPLLTVVDKRHALDRTAAPSDLVVLPETYVVPGFGTQQLRAEAASALRSMLDAAHAAGHDLRVRSSYRSYETQVDTYAYWVSTLGQTEANRISAKPGHSEHQLGTTADLTVPELDWQLSESLADTSAGRWLLVHATSYGFALSYPPRTEAITGYASEPWHYRYVGRSTAEAWAKSGLTLGVYLAQLGGSRSLGQRSSLQ
ncbi:MAG: M15 family metallopeptidase [Dehalococcoidia bacterium]